MSHPVRMGVIRDSPFRSSSTFGKYLGTTILPNRLRKLDYLPLLDKTINQIKGWQAKLLNMAGRTTLIKSVLNSYPLYAFQTAILPATVISTLDKHCKKFLWNKVGCSHYLPRTSWDIVTNNLTVAGLGIRKLKIWNLCFMAKLGWRMIFAPSKLWVKILSSRYLKKSDFFSCQPSANSSPMWKDILRGCPILSKGIQKLIGNGALTSLWYDHWVGDKPLYLYDEVDIPSFMEHWRVSSLITNNNWNPSRLPSSFPITLKNLIQTIPLPTFTNTPDSFYWRFSKNGLFSVKSAYHNSIPPAPLPTFPWMKLWKIHSPYKYKMLLWNLIHQILPVGEILHMKVHSFNPNCPRCLTAVESHLHLFRDCPSSALLWSSILSSNILPSDFDLSKFMNLSWNEWLLFQFSHPSSWILVFLVAIWHIWRYRNKAVFEGTMSYGTSFTAGFWHDYSTTNLIFQDKPPTAVAIDKVWYPPPLGYIKLNFDGAWRNVANAGGGGVFRHPDGSWFLGYAAKFFASSPVATELMALKEGFNLAKDHNLDCLIIETDALEVKSMLTNIEDHLHSALANLIKDIASFLSSNACFSIKHAKRSSNTVAHSLAQAGANLNDSKQVYHSCPDHIINIYLEDLKAARQPHDDATNAA